MGNQSIKIIEDQQETIVELNGEKIKNLIKYTLIRSADKSKRARIILEIDTPIEEIKIVSIKE